MTGGAGQADLVGLDATGGRIDDAAHARKADRQAIDVVCRQRLQACHRFRCRLGLGVGTHKAIAAQGACVCANRLRTGDESEPFQIGAVREQAGPGEQMQGRLLKRDVPGVRYREGRGALACMMKPEPVLGRPVLVKPVGRFHRDASRQRRRHQLSDHRDRAEQSGEFGEQDD